MRLNHVFLYILLITISYQLFAVDSLEVRGRVTLNDVGQENVSISGHLTDENGVYSFKIPMGVDSTIEPTYKHFLFEPSEFHITADMTELDSVHFSSFRQIKRTILLAGQSNTGLQGKPEFFISDNNSIDPNIPYYYKTLSTLEGKIQEYEQFGFEVVLARTLYNHYSDSLAAVKIYYGGTNLYSDWQVGGYAWEGFLNGFNNADSLMLAEGYDPKYIGVFWFQGESDLTETRSTAYAQNLIDLVDRFRNTIINSSQLASLPFICVRTKWIEGEYQDVVRAAQMDIVNQRVHTGWIDIDDCDPYRISSNDLHFNGNALNRIGFKFAMKYLELLGTPYSNKVIISLGLNNALFNNELIVSGDKAFIDEFSDTNYDFEVNVGDSVKVVLEALCDYCYSTPNDHVIPYAYDQSALYDPIYNFEIFSFFCSGGSGRGDVVGNMSAASFLENMLYCGGSGCGDAMEYWQNSEIPLPINLVTFNAVDNRGVIKLSWKTASEINNARFHIYRNDIVIASIEGAGTSSEPHHYTFIDSTVIPGESYSYLLSDVNFANKETKHTDKAICITMLQSDIPKEFALKANYPNPFNPGTMINYELPEKSHVMLTIYNMNGKVVSTLVKGSIPAGFHEVYWDASGFSSGLYIYRLTAGNYVKTRKMVLIK